MTPCHVCGSPAVQLIGSKQYCATCANAILQPLRAKWLVATVIGAASDLHPPEMRLMQCVQCGASWVGYPDEQECEWCIRRAIRVHEDERRALLWPEWSTARNGQKYDDLDPVNQMIWRETREQTADTDTVVKWLAKLSAAVANGDIPADQAAAAIVRETHGH